MSFLNCSREVWLVPVCHCAPPKVSPVFISLLTFYACSSWSSFPSSSIHPSSSSSLLLVCALLRSLCAFAQSSCADERAARHEHCEPRHEEEGRNVSVSLNRDVIVIDERRIGSSNDAENAARTPERVEGGGVCEERSPARLRAISSLHAGETGILRTRQVWRLGRKCLKLGRVVFRSDPPAPSRNSCR